MNGTLGLIVVIGQTLQIAVKSALLVVIVVGYILTMMTIDVMKLIASVKNGKDLMNKMRFLAVFVCAGVGLFNIFLLERALYSCFIYGTYVPIEGLFFALCLTIASIGLGGIIFGEIQ